jgi:hypothetical protein
VYVTPGGKANVGMVAVQVVETPKISENDVTVPSITVLKVGTEAVKVVVSVEEIADALTNDEYKVLHQSTILSLIPVPLVKVGTPVAGDVVVGAPVIWEFELLPVDTEEEELVLAVAPFVTIIH